MVKKACFLLIIVLLPLVLDAQSFYQRRRNRSFTAFAGTGIATYFGELKASRFDYFKAKPNLEFGVRSYFLDYFSGAVRLTAFSLEGADSLSDYASIQERNLSFRSRDLELVATGSAYLFPMAPRFYQRNQYNAFITLGAGLVWSNPRAKYQGEWYSLRKLQTEFTKYSPYAIVIPVGLGVSYKIDAFFNVAAEGIYRFSFSDYLDDVSTQHYDQSKYSDPIAAALADRRPEIGVSNAREGNVRGNPKRNDGYFLLNIKIEYFLPLVQKGNVSLRRNRGRRR